MKIKLLSGTILDTDEAKAQQMIACGIAKKIEEKKAEPKKAPAKKKTTTKKVKEEASN